LPIFYILYTFRFIILTIIAAFSKGEHIFVADTGDVSGDIIKLLKKSLTPYLTDVKVEFDKNIVSAIHPQPSQIPFVSKNTPLDIYLFFNDKVKLDTIDTKIKLSCFDSTINARLEFEVPINSACKQHQSVSKLGIKKIITILEDELLRNVNDEADSDVYFAEKADTKQMIIDLSVANQVLSTQTAFITVIQERDDAELQEFKEVGQSSVLVQQV